MKRPLLVGLVLAMFSGIAIVYFRLWAIDSDFSSEEDREFLRKQFDRANMEAMDESAEWRMKYDGEVERARQYEAELMQGKEALESANKRVGRLKKENTGLHNQVESMTQEIKSMKQNCNCNLSSTQI